MTINQILKKHIKVGSLYNLIHTYWTQTRDSGYTNIMSLDKECADMRYAESMDVIINHIVNIYNTKEHFTFWRSFCSYFAKFPEMIIYEWINEINNKAYHNIFKKYAYRLKSFNLSFVAFLMKENVLRNEDNEEMLSLLNFVIKYNRPPMILTT